MGFSLANCPGAFSNMAPKVKSKRGSVAKKVTTKRAEEARKKELVHGEGCGRMAVLDSAMVTGVLTSRVQSRDVVFEQVNVSLHGRELITDAALRLNHGRRYGLIGSNGSGKSTLLAAIAA